MFGVKIQDDKKLIRSLERLPAKVQQKVVRSAGTFAMTPVLKTAKKLAPLGDGLRPNGQPREHLRDTLKKKTKLYRSSGTAVTTVGHDYFKTPHAHLVHDGTKPRQIVGKYMTWFDASTGVLGETINVQHPGNRGSKHIERAFENQKLNVLKRLSTKMGKGILKEAAKL